MGEVKVTVNQDGPYKVEGPIEMTDHEGRKISVREGRAVHLCRCGRSDTKPFCDGTHKDVDFEGENAAVIEEAYAD